MTIIRPHAPSTIKYFLYIVFGVLLICGAFYISEYSSLAELRHTTTSLKGQVVGLQTANADLKNELYRMIDPARLETAAIDSGLTLDKRPHYVTTRQ